jgi:hypothetical protein
VRRLLLVVPLLAAVALFGALRTRPDHSLAISYPAGWNLISGPDGSLVRGATGVLYTFQPGDIDYEQIPVTAPLHGGYGYWAYFPTGGSIDLAAGTPRYNVTLLPGSYAMIGNPSGQISASVQGADDLELYDPVSGTYSSSNQIPAGQGAWATASGTIIVTGVGNNLPITVVSSTPTPAPYSTAAPTSPYYAARCIDGTYDYRALSAVTCQGHGGIAVYGVGPMAQPPTPTPLSGRSQPQAACNDGKFDYSGSVNPCSADGGVAYYIALPSQRVAVSPAPTQPAVAAAVPQTLNLSVSLSPADCSASPVTATASVSATGFGATNGAAVVATVVYSQQTTGIQNTFQTSFAPSSTAGQYATTIDISSQPSHTRIDLQVTASLPGATANALATAECIKP